ncbi:E3 ubiquitin-protein ligase UPL7 isoform X2 [Ananas comosus]|uniref:HECT-type E3 ubiquitin transferase n=1 Tax=Ananas comosus TaxID=4615 RepID=A0A6P5F6N1_ANACO|nr:E3 ubiquitin-protein ligase UPL7 isoform X2 [Ananas comosus]
MRVWRRYSELKKVSQQLQEEWEALVVQYGGCITKQWISNKLLRPFLFIAMQSTTSYKKQQLRKMNYVSACFKILLSSINSYDMEQNFCSLAVGTLEERSTWLYQAKKLLSLCSLILAECDFSRRESDNMVALTALAMRLVISLTDLNGWKCLKSENTGDADVAVKRLIGFMSTRSSGMYSCIRRFVLKLGAQDASQRKAIALTDDQFLITASAVTLGLRPFHLKKSNINDADAFDVNGAIEEYILFILTVPYLCQRLPSFLLPALKHESVLLPSLNILLISRDKIFEEISKLEQSEEYSSCVEAIPYSGWALANVINLAIDYDDKSAVSGNFVQGLDCRFYIHVVNCLSQNFLYVIEKMKALMKKDDGESSGARDPFSQAVDSDNSNLHPLLYIDLLKPVYQQWHLRKLLMMTKENISTGTHDSNGSKRSLEEYGNFKLLNIICFYYYMLRIFSFLNPFVGSSPILNVLSFTPGFLRELWEIVEGSIFTCGADSIQYDAKHQRYTGFGSYSEQVGDIRHRRSTRDMGNKWVNVLQKITGKSTEADADCSDNALNSVQFNENEYDLWDVEAMKQGPQFISKDLSHMLHLFCATYGHLLLVLDDIEFYEKQVPFTLAQQRRIASVLNTLVYNSFIYNGGKSDQPLMDVAVRCLHLLYERYCRHRFCPTSLWLAPAREGRVPIAAAARTHEAAFANLQYSDASTVPTTSSALTTVPHVYPFEERVQMFREFIKLDKVSRRVAGEVSGPGPGSIEVVIRRDHVVEDGYRQLNYLGSRLKSCIHVSFISECGLPEAGLDYGGLSKEFLTDLSRAAFNPEYGLFSQTSTSDSSLIPNMSARLLENGIEMIEFLGRVVGKALYEGILLDYSFSLVFVQKLLGRYSFLDELSTLDSELYRNLMYLKHFDGDVGELSLDFTVTEELGGKMVVAELRPGGKNMPVTNENKLQYVHAMADYKLNRQILPFANAFYRGLSDLISPSWLSLFNANEFNQLLSGGRQDIDVDDLRNNTKYTGGYSNSSRTVKLFWEVVKGFKPIERCMLVKFVTSCSRAPLLGFKYLQPPFTIHKVACDVPLWATIGGQDVDRLPSASTCYNTLKLPTYKRSSTLRNKLLYAITSNTGFELS